PPSTALPDNPILTNRQWKTFWALAIPLHARTIWLRLLHNKIPHRTLMYVCRLCSSSIPETLDHFLYDCPLSMKFGRLSSNATIHLSSTLIDPTSYKYFKIFAGSLPLITLDSLPSPSTLLFACTLLGIWHAHWAFIFHSTPFVPTNVITSIARILSRLENEELYSSDIP
ncbi:hypothetical protein BDF20DRAFT_816269, partial [Mycotypha africana]|uniref:uncharacterized protein n=1 Tax=Mycotypha africana TaxID=64632 RepID=UPI0022FFD7FD